MPRGGGPRGIPRGGKGRGGRRGAREQPKPSDDDPAGPEAVLWEAEAQLERGERKLRDKEPAKARAMLTQAVEMLEHAGLVNTPRG